MKEPIVTDNVMVGSFIGFRQQKASRTDPEAKLLHINLQTLSNTYEKLFCLSV